MTTRASRCALCFAPRCVIALTASWSGEVRGGEALDLLKAWNTGHPGGLATIHADSARQGLDRLEQCVSEATATPSRALIASGIHAVVFMAKTAGGKRYIKEVLQVNGLTETGYDTTTIWEAP
ncbi:ATPase, T2SS/T4P/T4SS family [Vibrio parahaemolyticus]|nr:ATPase, T2SS/T4P/T4SS family [Vibrio parahaemolyticus]